MISRHIKSLQLIVIIPKIRISIYRHISTQPNTWFVIEFCSMSFLDVASLSFLFALAPEFGRFPAFRQSLRCDFDRLVPVWGCGPWWPTLVVGTCIRLAHLVIFVSGTSFRFRPFFRRLAGVRAFWISVCAFRNLHVGTSLLRFVQMGVWWCVSSVFHARFM